MTNLLTLLAEAECWLGVEPLGEAQWAEVAELRDRVLRAIGASAPASEKEPLPSAAAETQSLQGAARPAGAVGGAVGATERTGAAGGAGPAVQSPA